MPAPKPERPPATERIPRTPADVAFFVTPADFRAWLTSSGTAKTELWVGFYKKASGRGGITYPEAVDEALCFGWIDGIRKTIDAESFTNRFTPRKSKSTWSLVNVRRVGELSALGLMAPPGIAAFEARTSENTGVYSAEQPVVNFEPALELAFRASPAAWQYWEASPRGYRKTSTWWVVSAKRPETREKRLAQLIDCCRRGVRIPLLTRPDRS